MTPKADIYVVNAKKNFLKALNAHIKNYEQYVVINEVREHQIKIDYRLSQLAIEVSEVEHHKKQVDSSNVEVFLFEVEFSRSDGVKRTHVFVQDVIDASISQLPAKYYLSTTDKKGLPVGLSATGFSGDEKSKTVSNTAIDAFLSSFSEISKSDLSGVGLAIADDISRSVDGILKAIEAFNRNSTKNTYSANLCAYIEKESLAEQILSMLRSLFSDAKIIMSRLNDQANRPAK